VYADWLEERGDARSKYLRADCELYELIGSGTLNKLETEAKISQIRFRLKKLAKGMDPAWVAIFDALRPTIFRCRFCRKAIAPREAIDTDPHTFQILKTSRYCRRCYERLRSDTSSYNMTWDMEGSRTRREASRSTTERDYHGGAAADD
jgi:hypothetical protein